MKFRIFQYPLPCPSDPVELNAFLDSHRIVSVHQYLATTANVPTLVFVAQYVAGEKQTQPAPSGSRDRVDYRAILDSEQFSRFSQLRAVRKRLAEEEGLPVYAIFSNAQLAEMVQSGVSTTGELSAIEGIGEARIRKYSEPFLAVLNEKDKTDVENAKTDTPEASGDKEGVGS